ncbi:MAG: hypothetical protein AAGK00_13335 [Pseudomonadota bacterium]
MIVFNAGVPRSGTVLVNAILRQLFKVLGREIHQTNPHAHELPELIRDLQETGRDASQITVVHTDSWDDETAKLLDGSRHVRAIVNFRDPRDICVSLMQLHDRGLDEMIKMVEGSYRLFDATVAALDPLIVPYELLVADRRGHIFQIARQVDLWPSMPAIDQVDRETSVAIHTDIMRKVQVGEVDHVIVRPNKNRDMHEDRDTLITDRHIQSGVAGRWRDELPKKDQARLARALAPLVKRLGYPP